MQQYVHKHYTTVAVTPRLGEQSTVMQPSLPAPNLCNHHHADDVTTVIAHTSPGKIKMKW